MNLQTNRFARLTIALAAVLALLFSQARAQTATADLYKTRCALCHGADGSGDTPAGKKLGAHDFRSEEVQKQTDAKLTEAIAKGLNKMPGYEKSLKPEQVKDLVAFVRTLAKKRQ